MTKRGRYEMKLCFEEQPIIKGTFDNLESIEDIFRTLKKKFK